MILFGYLMQIIILLLHYMIYLDNIMQIILCIIILYDLFG